MQTVYYATKYLEIRKSYNYLLYGKLYNLFKMKRTTTYIRTNAKSLPTPCGTRTYDDNNVSSVP